MKDVGLDVEWRIIQGDDEFFGVTKTIHNALQGDPHGLTPEQEDDLPPLQRAERRGVRGRLRLRDRPRPAAGGDDRPLPGRRRASWIWRCHIDLSTPNRAVLDFLAPSLERYDAAIFHMPEYVPQPRRRCARPSSGRPRSIR